MTLGVQGAGTGEGLQVQKEYNTLVGWLTALLSNHCYFYCDKSAVGRWHQSLMVLRNMSLFESLLPSNTMDLWEEHVIIVGLRLFGGLSALHGPG